MYICIKMEVRLHKRRWKITLKRLGDGLTFFFLDTSMKETNSTGKELKYYIVNIIPAKINHVEHFRSLSQNPSWLNFPNQTNFFQVVRTFSAACDKDLYTKITFPHVVVKSSSRCFYVKWHTPMCEIPI